MKLAALLLVVGCVEPSLLQCPDSGLVCPTGDVCDTIHHLCITPGQETPCVGLADDTVCEVAGTSGYCRDQICLLPVCGNNYVDLGEKCDDGNAVSGDGCNALCTSTEQCGNGFLDPGEACDDGDRLSGDGCDSLCNVEMFAWQTVGIVPRYETGNHHAVYDPVRKQIVLVADDVTWTWDGATWKTLAIGGIPGDTLQAGWYWHQLVWDDKRQTVVLVGAIASNTPQVWEWNGLRWSQIATPGTLPLLLAPHMAYDASTNKVIAVAGTTGTLNGGTFVLDVDAGTWATRAGPPVATIENGFSMAYDAKRSVVVLAASENGFVSTTEWNGVGWSTAINGGLPAFKGMTLEYDGAASATLAVGGRIDDTTVSTQVAGWDGLQWVLRTTIEQLTVPKELPEVVIDPDRNTRVIWGGNTGTSETSSLYELGSDWSGPLGTYPPDFAQQSQDYVFAYDTDERRVIVLGGSLDGRLTSMWGWNGAWTMLASCPLNAGFYPSPPAIAYDPERKALVMAGQDKLTYLFKDGTWTTLSAQSPLSFSVAITYDPVRKGLVAVDGFGTWLLASTSLQWIRITGLPGPTGSYPSLAFDASTSQIVYVDATSTSLLKGTTWTRTLSPGISYDAVANARRGSVELFAPAPPDYELSNGQFSTETNPPPPAGFYAQDHNTMYAPAEGAVIQIGNLHYSRLIQIRTSSAPLDRCTGGDDDGDGLVDCADPDCFWSCTPACPPHTSC